MNSLMEYVREEKRPFEADRVEIRLLRSQSHDDETPILPNYAATRPNQRDATQNDYNSIFFLSVERAMNVKGQTMIVVCFFPSLLFGPLFFLPESFEFLFQSIAKFVFYSAQSAKPQFGLTQNWMPF